MKTIYKDYKAGKYQAYTPEYGIITTTDDTDHIHFSCPVCKQGMNIHRIDFDKEMIYLSLRCKCGVGGTRKMQRWVN